MSLLSAAWFFAFVVLAPLGCASAPRPVAATPSTSSGDVDVPADPNPPRADLPLFDGCTAMPKDAVGWGYVCKGFAASVTDQAETPARTLLDGPSAGFRASSDTVATKLPGTLDESEETYLLAGKPREGRRMRFTANGKMLARLDAAVVPIEGSGLRLVTCGGGASDEVLRRCDALLDVLAREPWRKDAVQGVPVVNDAVALVGRALEIPKNCHAAKTSHGGLVWCDGELTLSWSEDPDGPNAQRATFASSMPATATPIPCTFDSVAGACDVSKDDKGTAWRAEAKVRGTRVVAVCASRRDALPTVCNEIFSVSPGH